MIETFTAGGIVLGDHGTIALVQHAKGNGAWLFPKGHKDAGETDEETARREIAEETGLANLEYLDDLGSYARHPIHVDGTPNTKIMKNIHMYLFAVPQNSTLAPTLEIGAAKWVALSSASTEIGNSTDQAWFAKVYDRVREAVQRD
jgi:8-oxo-dGTP pyrophosphatase MutT (NUDIX family)